MSNALFFFLALIFITISVSGCGEKVKPKADTKEELLDLVNLAIEREDYEMLFKLYYTVTLDESTQGLLKKTLKGIFQTKDLKIVSKEILSIGEYENMENNQIDGEKIIKNKNVTHIILIKRKKGKMDNSLVFPIFKNGFWYITINESL